MSSIVKCDNCPRCYQFTEAQAGTAWIRVEVLDGDEEPNQGEPVVLMTATFCCPECAEDYLCNPELMGTIRFPDPIGCHGAREANFPIISRNCHDQMHSSCCGRAVKQCQCYCHAEKAESLEGNVAVPCPKEDPSNG
jgi:hypothetical protein